MCSPNFAMFTDILPLMENLLLSLVPFEEASFGLRFGATEARAITMSLHLAAPSYEHLAPVCFDLAHCALAV